MNELPPVLTTDDVARYLRLCTKTVKRRIKEGRIKSYLDGTRRRIRREALLEYVERLERESVAK
jgi:excisionase family DNA binding protein